MRELEERYPDELVVVGVHSGKFRAERVTGNVAQAADRLAVRHPVVNDRQYRIWRAFGVTAWPTIVVVDPAGGYVGSQPGEFLAGDLAPVIDDLIEEFDRDDAPDGARLDRRRLGLRLPPAPSGALRYPGRVLALPGGRLFVSDTGQDRILELQLEDGDRAHLVRVIGSGRSGFADGPLEEAAFKSPEGLAHTPARFTGAGLLTTAEGWSPAASAGPFLPAPGTLFVADEENHAVRVVDLERGVVGTLAGTGRQARRVNESGTGAEVPLSSPWDVELVDGALVVAMAGFHQLWRIDLETEVVEPFVGTGREDITDGPSQNCTLAQPTGLRLAGDRLYFADSESSAVREAVASHAWSSSHAAGPDVTSLVGTGLFEFGDEDGQGGHARLQHPYDLAVGPAPGNGDTADGGAHDSDAGASHDGPLAIEPRTDEGRVLYVADTYNNKIKLLDPRTKRCATFAGSGEEGLEDGDALQARFDEPQGVAVADGLLFVADTNNHALRVVDLREPRLIVRTIELAF